MPVKSTVTWNNFAEFCRDYLQNFVCILKICKMPMKHRQKFIDILKIILHFQNKFRFLKFKSEYI